MLSWLIECLIKEINGQTIQEQQQQKSFDVLFLILISPYCNQNIKTMVNMQKSSQSKTQTPLPQKRRKIAKKQCKLRAMVKKGCSSSDDDVPDEIDYVDCGKMLEMTFQQGQKGEKPEQKGQKKSRNSNPEKSRAEKDHLKAIVDQMADQLGGFEDLQHRSLQGMLQTKESYAPTKFVLLCTCIYKFRCFEHLNPLLNHRIALKWARIEKKYARNESKLLQCTNSMNFIQRLKENISKQCHFDLPLAPSFQDSIIEEAFREVHTPKKSTEGGLKRIRGRKVEQAEWLKMNLCELQRHMSPQATGAEERQEHIRPNFGGIAIEDVRVEYLGGEDEVFFTTELEEET